METDYSEYEYSPVSLGILDYLKKTKAATRQMLVDELKVPRTTIYDALMRMINLGYIKKTARLSGMKGRPSVYFVLVEMPILNNKI